MTKRFVWGKITTEDYYHAYEELELEGEGHMLNSKVKTGLAVKVKWPNKDETLERLVVKEGEDSAQIDMNNSPDRFPTRILYVSHIVNGTKVLIPLKNKRIKVGVWL